VDTVDQANSGSITWIRGNKINQKASAEQTQASVVVCEKNSVAFQRYASDMKCFVVA
tara:strand:+ start:264 stop:434 length:171 start_codon:yes stop_codon:yes gene_type:complete